MIHRVMCFLGLLFVIQSDAQNLVPNGSFEEYSECPDGGNQLSSRCLYWENARGSCEYYNSCAQSCGLDVPCNVQGWQSALSGNAYAGLACTDVPELTYREHMIVELIQPLTTNETYYYSMYVNNAIKLEQSPNKASNGQGAWFTTVDHNTDTNPSPVLNNPHILNLDVVNDSTNWVQVKGSFVADSAYTYLVIGGFLDSSNIEVVNVSGEGPFENNGEAYYFVDEVRLSTDSVYAFEDLTTSVEQYSSAEVGVYPNPFFDELNINSEQRMSVIKVHNAMGQVVDEFTFLPSHQQRIDLAKMPAGLYYIEILLEGVGSIYVKVIKSW